MTFFVANLLQISCNKGPPVLITKAKVKFGVAFRQTVVPKFVKFTHFVAPDYSLDMAIFGSLEIIVPLVSEFWTKIFFKIWSSCKDNFLGLSHLKHGKHDF